MMRKFFGHLHNILVHKFWVAYYCFQCGLYWRGLMHDMSKFHPVEFWESVKYYQGDKSPIPVCKKDNGGISKAWLHHKGCNSHHFEYWVDGCDGMLHSSLPMPFDDALEMICDWFGAGRTYQGKNFTFMSELSWWRRASFYMSLNYRTYNFAEASLYHIIDTGKFNRKELKEIYDKYNAH